MANSADPDQLASSEANWSGTTLFAKQGISGLSRTRLIMNFWNHFSSEILWAIFTKFMWSLLVREDLKFAKQSHVPSTKMVTIPIYWYETFKNLFLQNQESFEAEYGFTALGMRDQPNIFQMRILGWS